MRRLLSPLTLRGFRLPSRVVFTAHTVSFGENGLPGPRARAYYEARAAGGAGLIVMEPLPVHPTAGVTPQNYRFASPGFADALARVVEAVHAHGTVFVSQLYHLGRNADDHATLRERWAPSADPVPDGPGALRAIDEQDIAELVEGHVRAAETAVAAGADGVECMFAYDTLVDGFMSVARNRRTDGYGGSFENRMRLAREILDALRRAIGADRLLGVTLSAGMDGYANAAAHLAARCDIDYVGVGNGSYEQPHLIVPPLDIDPGFGVPFAARAKELLPGTAVIAEGRILSPEIADRALEAGACDLVGMTRALIADPDLPRKVMAGEEGRIRGCIGDNLCIARRIRKFPVACLQNPQAGFEHLTASGRLPARRRIVVVGGGPAGLEAARSAAAAGHDVTLLEREPEVGGQLRQLAALPRLAAYLEVARWRAHELDRLGADVRTASEASAEDVERLRPELVVVATGSVPQPEPGVLTVADVLAGAPAADGGTAVVVDDEGTRKALGVAELLAMRGCRVELVPNGIELGADLVPAFALPVVIARLRELGVHIVEAHVAERIEPDRVTLRERHGNTRRVLTGTVVHCARHVARDELVAELRARGLSVHVVGDARAPRQVADAIRDGAAVAHVAAPAPSAAAGS